MSNIEVRLAVLEERSLSDRRQLDMQAKEYERRLSDLNHAHEKQVEDQRTYVSMDKFEGFSSEISSFRETTKTKLAELDGKAGGIGMARGNLFQLLPIIISLVALLFVALRAYKG